MGDPKERSAIVKVSIAVLLTTVAWTAIAGGAVVVLQSADTSPVQNVSADASAITKISSRAFLLSGPVSEAMLPGLGQLAASAGEAANDNKRVLLTIESPGGDVEVEGKIISVLMDHSNIDTYVPAMAASAAANIWLEGSKRFADANGEILFHGTANALGKESESIQLFNLLMRPAFDELLATPQAGVRAAAEKLAASLTMKELSLFSHFTLLSDPADVVIQVAEHLPRLRTTLGLVSRELHDANIRETKTVLRIVKAATGSDDDTAILGEVFGGFDSSKERFMGRDELLALGLVNTANEDQASGAPRMENYSD